MHLKTQKATKKTRSKPYKTKLWLEKKCLFSKQNWQFFAACIVQYLVRHTCKGQLCKHRTTHIYYVVHGTTCSDLNLLQIKFIIHVSICIHVVIKAKDKIKRRQGQKVDPWFHDKASAIKAWLQTATIKLELKSAM